MASSSNLTGLIRMPGLASGLDIESLVKAMSSKTKGRLNTKKQKMQTLNWQQAAYREQISSIRAFQEKYLSASSPNSIKLNANMAKFKAESSNNSKVTATASANALAATYTIKEATAATKASISSSSENVINNTIRLDCLDRVEDGQEVTLKVNLDGTTKEIKFIGGTDTDATKANFLQKLNESFSSGSFSFENGNNLKFTSGTQNDGIHHTFNIKYNTDIGLMNDAYSDVSRSATLGSISFKNGLQYSGYEYEEKTALLYETDPDTGENVLDEDGNPKPLLDSDGNMQYANVRIETGYYAMNINGKDFKFYDNTSLTEMMNQVNNANIGVKMTFSSFDQSFKLETTETGAQQKLELKEHVGGTQLEDQGDGIYIAMDRTGNLAQALFGNAEKTARGTDSTITISNDGSTFVTYANSSNKFTFDGTTIDITNLGTMTAEDAPVTITTTRDTSGIKDMIKNFIDDYNKLIEGLNGAIGTRRPKSNGSYYDPLTDEQEEEMDSAQIEKWNEQAKTGLLYGDSYLNKFFNNFTATMTESLNGFSLSDLGIKFKEGKDDLSGLLYIDEDKLESCLQNYGDVAANFFTNLENGLGAKLSKTFDKAISTTPGKVGYITQISGIEGTSTENVNSYYSQIKTLQSLIDTLQKRYDDEMSRYWKRFTALETHISNMNSQSSIFSPQQ